MLAAEFRAICVHILLGLVLKQFAFKLSPNPKTKNALSSIFPFTRTPKSNLSTACKRVTHHQKYMGLFITCTA